MKESDYILATNLAKLRSAHRALSDTIYERQGDADLRGDALRAINKLTDMAEEAIGDLELDDDESNPSGADEAKAREDA